MTDHPYHIEPTRVCDDCGELYARWVYAYGMNLCGACEAQAVTDELDSWIENLHRIDDEVMSCPRKRRWVLGNETEVTR